ncbi:TonB-dependent receptor [Pseudopedobacter beijingensis]|uniref:TonB-dependent receptor n=1 Tax=Pseudopedobacter beijingensis TaxID=1207056 RepID=A0ABW4IDG4_9SPHI
MRVKLTCAFIVIAFLQLSFASNAQNITLTKKNISLTELFKEIKKQSGYDFVYKHDLLIKGKSISIDVKNRPLKEVLDQSFENQPFSYSIESKTVVVLPKEKEKNVYQVSPPLSGKVVDKDGNPLAGVSVAVKGESKGTQTDANGNFTLAVSTGSTLVFSYLGFVTQDIVYNNQKAIDVVLSESPQALNEVVVTAYGRQQSKASNVAAISTIKSAEIKQSPAASLSVALAGRLPGLTAIQRSGEPGREDNMLRIRGRGTFNTSDPLVVVDGVERADFLNSLDPNEIESISILKDASSTALYGVRGANGVIIVTTKRGEANKQSINFSAEQSLQNYTRFPERLNAYDYAVLMNEARINAGSTRMYTDDELAHWKNQDWPEAYPDIDWLKEITKPFSSQNRYNLNISGGMPKVKYFINAGALLQDGMFKPDQTEWEANSTLKRYNFRTNFDANLNNSLTASLQLAGNIEKQNRAAGLYGQPGQDATAYIINAVLRQPAGLFNPLTPNGEVQNSPQGISDWPVYGVLNRSGYVIETRNNITGTFSLNQDLSTSVTPGLSVKGLFAFDSRASNIQRRERNFERYQAIIVGDKVEYQLFQGTNTNLSNAQLTSGFLSNSTLQFSANYARKFGIHDVGGLLLYQQEQKHINAELPYNYRSFASRFTYGYAGRYLAEINMGYNGSEQFAKGNRYGFFPAFSAGWVITEEEWGKKIPFAESLKLRASYGIVGNDRMSSARFLYQDNYGKRTGANMTGTPIGWSNLSGGTVENFIGNPDITWETSKKANIGIDATIFKNFSVVAEYFQEERSDILTTRGTVPAMFGNLSALPPLNFGEVKNKGYEVELGYSKAFKNGLSLMLRGNTGYAHNKIIFKDEPLRDDTWSLRYPTTGLMIGQPVGYEVAGYFNTLDEIESWADQSGLGAISQLGDFKYVDKNRDGVIDEKDRVVIGYPNEPLLNYGFSFSLSYKNFDMAGLFQGSAMKSLYISGQGAFASSNLNLSRYLGRWNPERYAAGEEITYPRLTVNSNSNEIANSFFVENASFIRLKTLELGYTLPARWTNHINAKSVRLFFTGLNLFTWDKMKNKDYDPETANGNGTVHPLFKVYNFGLTASF